MPKYTVKADEQQKYVTIHGHLCGHVRKGDDWFGRWKTFPSLEKAEAYAKRWEAKGHLIKYCRHCMKQKNRVERVEDEDTSPLPQCQ